MREINKGLVSENNHVGHEAECVEGECLECCSRELSTYALPLVCAEVVCKISLKGVPQNVSSEHFWGYVSR